jgi:uncharacterized membrane protein YidH (DUF202 family)
MSALHIEAGRSTLAFSLSATLVLGVVLILGGVALVYLGSTGDTELELFGNHFKSQNVGVVGIFCGAVLAVLGIRRTLLSLERLGRM